MTKVYLPQLNAHMLAATRSGLALTWKIVLVVELLGRSNGVGFELGVAFQLFDMTTLFAYTIAFTVIILLIEGMILRPWERYMTKWRTA